MIESSQLLYDGILYYYTSYKTVLIYTGGRDLSAGRLTYFGFFTIKNSPKLLCIATSSIAGIAALLSLLSPKTQIDHKISNEKIRNLKFKSSSCIKLVSNQEI